MFRPRPSFAAAAVIALVSGSPVMLSGLQSGSATEVPEAVRTPTRVPGVENVATAAVGEHFFVVARTDGSVMTWGYNNYGQLGNGQVGPMAGSERGRTMPFVVQGRPGQVPGLSDVVSVASGAGHALAVKRDGTVWGWGSNGSGQLGLGRTVRTPTPRPVQIPGVTGARAVAARNDASYAVLNDGRVLAWGDRLWRANNRAVSSETPVPVPNVSNVVAISAGLPVLALQRDGRVLAWGNGYLGDGSPAQRDYASVVVSQPATVQGIDDAVAVASGSSTAGVVRRDGTVWVWGDDNLGALGLGRPAPGQTERLAPVRVPGITGAVDLALAAGSSIVGADGSLRTWGDARLGATGRAGINRVASPSPVPGATGLVHVWASAYSNLALTRDGHLLAWGSVLLTLPN
jgi:alpha-tubulin suppressor-like RCC1 family protein